MGRPNSYSDEIGTRICERIADGESIRRICEDEEFPHRNTVRRWLVDVPAFSAKCARAWDEQADTFTEKQTELAEKVIAGEVDPHAAKVAVSTWQWLASKRAPKRYGDRLELAGELTTNTRTWSEVLAEKQAERARKKEQNGDTQSEDAK